MCCWLEYANDTVDYGVWYGYKEVVPVISGSLNAEFMLWGQQLFH